MKSIYAPTEFAPEITRRSDELTAARGTREERGRGRREGNGLLGREEEPCRQAICLGKEK